MLLVCLFAPSAWMISTIPPLWRDADAYVQTTENPLIATFWGHAPAYCYVTKVPLFIGERFERWRGNAPAAAPESSHPRLTDSGIWLLIIGQHLALCGAAFYFISAVSQFFWVRLALALAWASNSLFYTFAHCVGSETLGMILMVLLVVKALHLIQNRDEPGWKEWYVYTLILALCFLSRNLNFGLIFLLPAAFLLSWAMNRTAVLFAEGESQKVELRQLAVKYLRYTAIAIAVGLACVAVAHSIPVGLARKTRLHPHSRIGYTFLWRLHFLSALSPESRAALLEKVSARTPHPVRQLITLLGEVHAESVDLLEPTPFMRTAIPLFGGSFHWEELDRALNQMAFAFLWPPTPEVLYAARTDFVAVMKLPSTVISEYLFATTSYYFQHKEEMPACAELATFRDTNAEQILLPSRQLYFRLYRGLNGNRALVIWLIALLAFVVVARRKNTIWPAISALAIALSVVGLLIIAATCLLDEFSPRFGLPMWELLLLSCYILAGKTAEIFASEQSAGQRLPRKLPGLPKPG